MSIKTEKSRHKRGEWPYLVAPVFCKKEKSMRKAGRQEKRSWSIPTERGISSRQAAKAQRRPVTLGCFLQRREINEEGGNAGEEELVHSCIPAFLIDFCLNETRGPVSDHDGRD